VFALVGEWFALDEERRQLRDVLNATDALSRSTDDLREPLITRAREVVHVGLITNIAGDAAQLAAERQNLQAAAARFRELSTLLLPLGEQDIVVDNVHETLADWRGNLRGRAARVLRFLGLRVGVLGGLIGIVLAISEAWRRATFRYLHDARRRRQFLTLRRIAVGIALAVVLLIGFVSEIGSLATYIGFLTAGLAVALQNVILAVIAYFFLIGRHGVRVGDRITLAGVTGRVVDIGMVRLYLMELSGPDLHSTGRIVVLSNAVLFQPQALFKQIPGADYLWHTICLTLAPNVDLQRARERLEAAANTVYARYRSDIERQHAALQQVIDYEMTLPSVGVTVRLTANGVEFAVRYPLVAEHAVNVDQAMLKALADAIAQDPALPLTPSGAPALQGVNQ
jgi:small-conductance mechanosensitive channel